MAEDKVSMLDNGTLELKVNPISVTKNLAPKYLKLFSEFLVKLNALIVEDTFTNPDEFVGKVDALYEDTVIPCLLAPSNLNVTDLAKLDVAINNKCVLVQSKYYNLYANKDQIVKVWKEKENK